MFETIVRINREGTTVLLVEQNAKKALSIAHRAYVLETGSIVLSGTAAKIRDDPKVIGAYLGG
jgi:branched-chain amino acid transport system ATP-binding protein